MKTASIPLISLAFALAVLACPMSGRAQEVVQPLPGTTDADALAATMRRVAANPQDVTALIEAGELSLKVDDLSGAASLFARAEKVSPGNGRVKAGMASILVRAERPGEALRYFGQAEAAGAPVGLFAADRGLAYDLIGQQERAQRDYRLALRTSPDDETVRRYALSLGISGRKDMALDQLAPLIRKTDRGAWRARAFILAMNGDQAEASRIATTMMPPGMSAGLVPFLQRLPALPAIDRAFAVHFGEVRATPERLADARMAPQLAALGPDPYAPVQVAAVTRPVAQQADAKRKKSRKERREEERALAAARRAPPVQLAMVQPLPQPPSYTPPSYAPPSVTPAPTRTTPTMPSATTTRPPVALASANPMPRPTVTQATTTIPSSVATSLPPARSVAPVRMPSTTATPTPTVAADTRLSTPASTPAYPGEPGGRTVPTASSPPVAAVAASGAASPASVGVASPGSIPVSTAAASTPAPIASTPAPAVVKATPPPAARVSEDSILARIVASLSIPASELGVVEPVRAAPVPVVPDAGLAEARATAADDAADKKAAIDKIAAERLAEAEAKERADKRAEAKKAAADRLIADKKAATDKKALADKKAAAEKKALADKEAAEKKKALKADPPRIWVQVAGGAFEGDLPKAYAAVKAKAPDTFGSRGGWSTPLRATNRVLTGPFKTDAEARAFVNALAKKGVSAFTFSSDAGQKITKLPAR